jgi:hypothetical protein
LFAGNVCLKMLITELETCVQKFHQLWSAGHIAHLDMETHTGIAWVGLRVQLGHAPGILHQQPHPQPFQIVYKKKDSPSRQRRRTRRAAARQDSAEEVANEETELEKLPNEDAEKAKEPISASGQVVVNEANQLSMENKDIENESNVETVKVDTETEAEQATTVNVEDPGDTVAPEIAVIEEIADEVCDDVEYLETSEKPKELDRAVIDNLKLRSQYPRNCETCDKYLRNNLDFRKHVVACIMARK